MKRAGKQRRQTVLPHSGRFEPIPVDPDFPVSRPDFNTRTEDPDTAPHIHDLFEIGYCFDGTGIFIVGGKIFPFKSGDAVVINTHELHIAKGSPGGTTSWGFLFLDPVRLLADTIGSYSDCLKLSHYCGAAFRNLIDGAEHPEIAACIRNILFEVRDRPEGYRSMVRSLTWRLMLLLSRYYDAESSPHAAERDYRDIERIMPALNYIDAHYNEEISIPHLAGLCYASESNFRKLFHKAMGCAAMPYLMRIRLNVASTLLKNSDRSVLEIALECGFNTLSNFNRQFRATFGISPREFRKNS